MEDELRSIGIELKKMNENLSKIAKASERIADEIKTENSNTSSYTLKHKIVAALEKLTEAIKKTK
jgi:hypothetical protein